MNHDMEFQRGFELFEVISTSCNGYSLYDITIAVGILVKSIAEDIEGENVTVDSIIEGVAKVASLIQMEKAVRQ